VQVKIKMKKKVEIFKDSKGFEVQDEYNKWMAKMSALIKDVEVVTLTTQRDIVIVVYYNEV
jgi:hypothetical protein